MSIRNLDKIFKPRSAAIIGASDDPSKVGFTVLRNLLGAGFAGPVYPVNSRRESVQGVRAYPSIAAVPQPVDLAVICTPGPTVPGLIAECGAAGVLGIVILSAGFREAGAAGLALEMQLREEWRKHDGMRIIGPNCLGIMAPGVRLNATFAADSPAPGSVALISQSGALCTSLLDWAAQQQLGFSFFVSIGNMLDVSFGDLIDYFGADTATKSLILYVESMTDAREFMSAARAFSRTKPIVAYKAGRFAESAKAAASHTGAMVGEDAVLDAAFQRAGIERIYKMEEMFDCAELLARHAPPRGARLAIVTNAGGPGVMATDTLLAERGKLAALSDGTIARLNEFLPASWSHGNPVDVLGDAPPERFARAIEVVLADPLVDAALVILTPQAMTAPRETAEAVAKIAAEGAKPVLAAWVGGRRVQAGRAVLGEAGLPNYATPEQAVQAFMHLVSYARNLEMLYETPRPVPLAFPAGREQFDKQFRAGLQAGPGVLSEVESKRLLQAYGIPVTETFVARSADEAAERAEQVGYPVVLKVHSPQITHKTDVGGVKLNLANPADVRQAFEQIMSTAHSRRPEAHLEGVSVQPMADLKQGIELILGMKKDPTFGPVLMIGAGGVTAELFHDRALGLPPLNERLAYRMLQGLRSWPLLQGYRGRPPVNLDQLIELLLRFSHLVAWHPELKEFDINPLLVTPQAALALDARAVVDRAVLAHPLPPYAHLVIRPYPEEYIRQAALMNRTEVILRPIGPEDEPRWHQLLAACSAESLHARFRYLFKTVTHEMASRYCFIDYDRELAIVAEVKDTGEFAGIGRLVADPGHETAEFAILVADRWQGQGLGMMLTDYCLEIARDWEIGCVTAVTNFDNARMVSIFAERGFQIDWAAGGDLMARKVLT